MSTVIEEKHLSRKLMILLDELEEECSHIKDLVAQLKVPHLSTEQIEDILSELNTAVVHVNAHTNGLDKVISDEMDAL
jgi:hypothetical protein